MNCETKCPAIRLVMFPADTNPAGNIFGGIILSHIDVAGAIAARLHSKHRMVTVCMKEVIFKKPVKVGDILTCWTDVLKVGRTSVTVKIRVEAERQGEVIHVTDGEAIYVAVDNEDKPIPLDSPVNGNERADISPAPVDTSCDTTARPKPPAEPSETPAPAPTSAHAPAPTAEAKKEKAGKTDKKKNKKNKKKSKKDKKGKNSCGC
jgi:acyl-CoA thioesterase YciA